VSEQVDERRNNDHRKASKKPGMRSKEEMAYWQHLHNQYEEYQAQFHQHRRQVYHPNNPGYYYNLIQAEMGSNRGNHDHDFDDEYSMYSNMYDIDYHPSNHLRPPHYPPHRRGPAQRGHQHRGRPRQHNGYPQMGAWR